MMSMQTQLGTIGRHFALCSHEKVLVAAIAELVFALGASKVHATATSQIISKFAFRTIYAIQF
jgi:ABC-type histidine transport system ATPase subunit